SSEKAEAAELTFANMLEPPANDAQEAAKLRSALDKVAKGRPLQELDTELDPETRIHVLGLAPARSRLSVRFWEVDTLDAFTKRLALHHSDLVLNPEPWGRPRSVRYLSKVTAAYRKKKDGGGEYDEKSVSPLLA